MQYLQVLLASLFSLIALFVLTRLMGNKQVSQLTMFDYVIGISIGSIAAEMATELEKPLQPLLAMAIYALVALLISVLTAKSLKLRRMVFGKSVVLMRNGRLYRRNFKKAHLDLNEFLMQCRIAGYFDLSSVHTAVMEPNGTLSFFPYPDRRPATPQDMKLVPTKEDLFFNVIMDGRLLPENLKRTGYDVTWLQNELKVQGIKSFSEVFFAALDPSGTLNVFKNNDGEEQNDMFE